nr:PP2C family protein-serine/threonine phosphatase [Caldichromatium japonicum]
MIGSSISRPLCALAQANERIAQGALDVPLPTLNRGDEVGLLTDSFAAMQSALRQYIDQLQAATAAKERLESELRIARDIQMSILPRPLPLEAQRTFALCATLVPAREVSGDFYDFFMLAADRLYLVIADVSGKGVPSALFAVATKSLIKAKAHDRFDPAAILTEVNAELAADNPSNMFITVFCGVLDTRSGELIYTNAGHNPPILLGTDGRARWVKSQPQVLLGVMDGVCYRSDRANLLPGERLVLYTDGLTEAKNGQDELFREARLLAALESSPRQELGGLLAGVLGQVVTFVGAAPQADDMTLLAIEYRGYMAPVRTEIGPSDASSAH